MTKKNRLQIFQNDAQWYDKGLHFECTGCGQCCTGAPGYIWVNEEEIVQISHFLKISIEEFKRLYLRFVKGRFSLIEISGSYDCVFLKNKKCQIYQVRPTQCRTFPWWPQNLKSEQNWNEAARFCEGINPAAPLVSRANIDQQLEIQEKNPFP